MTMYAFGDEKWPGMAKLVEEMGEALTEVGRLMMTHGNPAHWKGDVGKRFWNEVADVHAAIITILELNADDELAQQHAKRMAMKVKRFLKWHRGSIAASSPAARKKTAMKTKIKKSPKSKGSKKDDGKKAATQHKPAED